MVRYPLAHDIRDGLAVDPVTGRGYKWSRSALHGHFGVVMGLGKGEKGMSPWCGLIRRTQKAGTPPVREQSPGPSIARTTHCFRLENLVGEC